ncbi:MAG: PEP-CTERM sorting domain-containing protein [Terrimicrobiaceae bacterium]
MKTTHTPKVVAASLSLAAVMAFFGTSSVLASTWTGVGGNWNSDGNPGWNGTGVPDAAGAIADFTSTDNRTVTVDASTRTVGTLTLSGAGDKATSISTTSFGLIFNNNGATNAFGTAGALISNTDSSTGTTNRLDISAGTNSTLADDLTIANTGGSTRSSGSIVFSNGFGGTGNLIISNVSNNIAAGQIVFGQSSNFAGSVLIQKGAVTFAQNTSFGGVGNAITLGSSGNSATLVSTGGSTTFSNNITVAATVGTNVLGSSNIAATNSTYAGTLLLSGGVSLTSAKTGGADVRYTGVISGAGGVTTVGTGETQFGNASTSITNTYQGNTTLAETSSLVLSDNAKLTFYVGANGVNNQITGTGQALTLDGDFVFDLTGAAAVGSWTIVDVANLNETFNSTFTVSGFTESSNVWTMTSGPTTYTFTEATGILTAVPEPSTWMLLALTGTIAMVFRRRRKD